MGGFWKKVTELTPSLHEGIHRIVGTYFGLKSTHDVGINNSGFIEMSSGTYFRFKNQPKYTSVGANIIFLMYSIPFWGRASTLSTYELELI